MTEVSIAQDGFLINGAPTLQGREFNGRSIEGLLINSRMTNALFDDLNPATRHLWAYPDTGEWDPDRNTDEFIAMIPEYIDQGLHAVTVNLQGGSPTGYYREEGFRSIMAEKGIPVSDDGVWAGLPSYASQPWDSSAFNSDGGLKPTYRKRAQRLLEACDQLGMVVILGIFYFGQDERLDDERAVSRAVDETVKWALKQNYRNVLLEINNECSVPRYEHAILQPHRVHELIRRARSCVIGGRRMLVGTSYGGGRIPDNSVVDASDFIMLHGNGVSHPHRIAEMVEATRSLASYSPKPILFTEDDHYRFNEPSNNFTAALSSYASWGYFDPGAGAGGKPMLGDYRNGYQNIPIDWSISTPRKRAFFSFVRRVVGRS